MEDIELDNFSLGKSNIEKEYRKWCIDHGLFINPLNDFIRINIVSYDCLFLPGIISNSDTPPLYPTIYYQLKQEYASARFLLFEGCTNEKPHFSDKGNLQVDTLDYAIYSFQSEKIKIAYRLCYSLFDKIAYLLNDYLKVGLPSNEVTLRKVWFQKGNKTPCLNPLLLESHNWALRGLYWLSKELNSNDAEVSSKILPESTELVTIRNFIEHKSFMITEIGNKQKVHHELTLQISRSNLIDKTMVLMKMARAAMMYLSFAIYIEESKKDRSNTSPVYMHEIPHEYKR